MIDSIKLMVFEHDNILRMNRVIRKACEQALLGEDICVMDFRSMIDFVKGYADKHHHGKEEQILFLEMQKHLGNVAVNLIKHGMLVEHDLGRAFIYELGLALDEYEKEKAVSAKLDIIANATSYTSLLARHISKENDVVYTYAQKNLSEAIMDDVNRRTEEFEKEACSLNIPSKYIDLLCSLEKSYCV